MAEIGQPSAKVTTSDIGSGVNLRPSIPLRVYETSIRTRAVPKSGATEVVRLVRPPLFQLIVDKDTNPNPLSDTPRSASPSSAANSPVSQLDTHSTPKESSRNRPRSSSTPCTKHVVEYHPPFVKGRLHKLQGSRLHKFLLLQFHRKATHSVGTMREVTHFGGVWAVVLSHLIVASMVEKLVACDFLFWGR